MDTAQRGMGLDYAGDPRADPPQRRRGRSGRRPHRRPASAPTSCRPARPRSTTSRAAYAGAAGRRRRRPARSAVLMCSRAPRRGRPRRRGLPGVYGDLLARPTGPVVLHWLGDDVRPGAGRLLGLSDLDVATETVLELIARARRPGRRHQGVAARRRARDRGCAAGCRPGVRLYTGDDFNYPELIRGDEHGHSDALLGIFDPIAPGRRPRLAALDAGDMARLRRGSSTPTVPLSRHLFADADLPLQDRASCSWPGWPATRTTSRWSAACSRPARPHLAGCSGSPTRPGLLPDPDLAARADAGLPRPLCGRDRQ